jgi:hypothetical protein
MHQAAIRSEKRFAVIIATAPDVTGIMPKKSNISFQNNGGGPLSGGNKEQVRHIQPERKK